MRIKTYDYDNRAKEIHIPDDKTISAIFVCVLSGDETGIICFTDGSVMRFDALCSGLRTHSFYDGSYVVTGENIEKWIEFDTKGITEIISYERQDVFDGGGGDEDAD